MNKLLWTKLQPLDPSVIKDVDSKPGVYRLIYKSSDGSFYAFYIGRADKSVREELTKIAFKDADNPCIRTHLENLECYFRYTYIEDDKARMNVHKTAYDHFKPKCNLETPKGEFIPINLK